MMDMSFIISTVAAMCDIKPCDMVLIWFNDRGLRQFEKRELIDILRSALEIGLNDFIRDMLQGAQSCLFDACYTK